MLVTRYAALALPLLTACVQAAPLGHEVDPEAGSSSTTSNEESGETTLDSTGLDEPGSSSGGEPKTYDLPLPTDWSPPDDCPNTAQQDLRCLPASATSCAGGNRSWWRAEPVEDERLWIAGIYQSRSDHSGNYHPQGSVDVDWSLAGSNTLVLSSYEPTEWTVSLTGDGALDRVILTGYHAQAINAPEGVDVEVHTYEQGGTFMACGFSVPGDGGGCEGVELVRFAQNRTGLPVSGFDGCYESTSFSFGL